MGEIGYAYLLFFMSGGNMKYYIFSYEKVTGPYTEWELKEVLKAFPLKEGAVVVDEAELEQLLDKEV